jgi:hypothetical protein
VNYVKIRLTVPTDELELGQILQADEDDQIRLAQLVPTHDTFVPYFVADADDPAAFEARIRADDRVARLHRLEDGPDERLYKVEWATAINGFVDALAAHDLVVDSAVGGPDEWRFRLRGPDQGNLSAFREALRDAGVSSTVDRVWHPGESDGDAYGLTAKQREAVTLAFTEGYFQVPRETNLTELAAEVGITRQSFSRRLNRGIQQVFAATVMGEL